MLHATAADPSGQAIHRFAWSKVLHVNPLHCLQACSKAQSWRMFLCRCHSCTLSRANSLARSASIPGSSQSSRRESSHHSSSQGDPDLDFDWDLPDLDALGRIVSCHPSFQHDKSFGARHDSATTIFPSGGSPHAGQSPTCTHPKALSISPDNSCKQASSRRHPEAPVSAFQQGGLMDSASTMYIQQTARDMPSASTTYSHMPSMPQSPYQTSSYAPWLPSRSPSPLPRASSGSPFLMSPSIKRANSWAGPPLAPILYPHQIRASTPTPILRPQELQQPLQQLPEASSWQEACTHLSPAPQHGENPQALSTNNHACTNEEQFHRQLYSDPAFASSSRDQVSSHTHLLSTGSSGGWSCTMDRTQSGPLSSMQQPLEQLPSGCVDRASSGPLSPMQQPLAQLSASLQGQMGPSPAASIAGSDVGSTIGSGSMLSRASMSLSLRRNSSKPPGSVSPLMPVNS